MIDTVYKLIQQLIPQLVLTFEWVDFKSSNEIPSFLLLNIFSWDFYVGCFTIDKRLELEDESPYRMRPRALLQNFQHTSLFPPSPSQRDISNNHNCFNISKMWTKMSDLIELKTYLSSALLSCRMIVMSHIVQTIINQSEVSGAWLWSNQILI